eukprot:CAMPEP_0178821908 /NCGR_PEP_ID=MMETSP0746-20121128/4314_1 /TAXON_ID=913974 /ORGANISM="Nitzschia punctata, Strain CCMP561" /LENGTH=1034 /DNA_ID=CAMNT_0020483387 /DNA_START=18 /DNA_END=3122 /DNA_ORIENTATION=-
MAPNTAKTHRERKLSTTRRTIGLEEDYSIEEESLSPRQNRDFEEAIQKLHKVQRSQTSTTTSRSSTRTKPPSFNFDDTRSLTTEVSILTMQTLEEPGQPRPSRSAASISSAGSSGHKRNQSSGSSTFEGPSASCMSGSGLEDVSFSGLFSTLEEESLAQRLEPSSSYVPPNALSDYDEKNMSDSLCSSTPSLQSENGSDLLQSQSVSSNKRYQKNCREEKQIVAKQDDSKSLTTAKAESLQATLGKSRDRCTETPRHGPSKRSEESQVRNTPGACSVSSGTSSSINRTAKRSNISSRFIVPGPRSVELSNGSSNNEDNEDTFREIVSLFEARSTRLEPPATKRLTGVNFPVTMGESNTVAEESDKSASNSTSSSSDQSLEDIDDDSTILPPWSDEESLAEPRKGTKMNPEQSICKSSQDESRAENGLYTESSQYQILSSSSIETSLPDSNSLQYSYSTAGTIQESSLSIIGLGALLPRTESNAGPNQSVAISPAKVENSLQYSVDTLSQKPVLISSSEASLLPAKPYGPVDLDETVADSCSDTSSLLGSTTWEKEAETPSKFQNHLEASEIHIISPIAHSVSVSSPFINEVDGDDDDDKPFVDVDDEENGDKDDEQTEESLRSNWSQFDEALLSHSYHQTMESISVSKRSITQALASDQGALLLSESNLSQHEKSSKFKGTLPSSSLYGYDHWKAKQEQKQKYFAKIHEKAMEQKQKRQMRERRQLSHVPTSSSSQNLNGQQLVLDTNINATESAVDRSMSSAITVVPSKSLMRTQKDKPQKPRWLRVLQRRDGNIASNEKGGKLTQTKKKKKTKKREPAIVTLDQFMRGSSDEPEDIADISLMPLNKLGPVPLTALASVVPRSETAASTYMHDMGTIESNPKILALQHLERERAKNRASEREKEKLEKEEQKRIAILKAQALENARALEADSNAGHSIFSRKSSSPSSTSPDQIINRTFSVESTNTAKSSVSPTSVAHLSPCVVCNVSERNHIALPCMHLYFCEGCAANLRDSEKPVCPVCLTPSTSFSKVYL